MAEIHKAFGIMSQREKEIYRAGQHQGAAQMLKEINAQHGTFLKAIETEQTKHEQSALQILEKILSDSVTSIGDRMKSAIFGTSKSA